MGNWGNCSLTSRAVSESVQKYAGLSSYPIWRQLGTTSWIGSVGSSGGGHSRNSIWRGFRPLLARTRP